MRDRNGNISGRQHGDINAGTGGAKRGDTNRGVSGHREEVQPAYRDQESDSGTEETVPDDVSEVSAVSRTVRENSDFAVRKVPSERAAAKRSKDLIRSLCEREDRERRKMRNKKKRITRRIAAAERLSKDQSSPRSGSLRPTGRVQSDTFDTVDTAETVFKDDGARQAADASERVPEMAATVTVGVEEVPKEALFLVAVQDERAMTKALEYR